MTRGGRGCRGRGEVGGDIARGLGGYLGVAVGGLGGSGGDGGRGGDKQSLGQLLAVSPHLVWQMPSRLQGTQSLGQL